MNRIIIVALLLLISGCITQPASLPKTWTYSGSDAVTLVAAVGIATNGEYKSAVPYHIFRIRSPYTSKPLIMNAEYDPGFRVSVSDYKNTSGSYGLIKFSVKPGSYYIDFMKSYNPAGVTITPTAKINIPIILESGKTYYLGTFTAHNIRENLFLGLKAASGAFWVADTISPANREAINKKYPELSGVNLENYPRRIEQTPYFFSSIDMAIEIISPTQGNNN